MFIKGGNPCAYISQPAVAEKEHHLGVSVKGDGKVKGINRANKGSLATMKRMLLGLVVLAVLGSPVIGNITLPWATNPYGTYQKWAFDTSASITDPAGIEFVGIQADSGFFNKNGVPTINANLLGVDAAVDPGWYTNLWGKSGVLFGKNAYLDITIPNIANPDLVKKVQLEVVFGGDLKDYRLDAPGSIVTLLDLVKVESDTDTWKDYTFTWEISPQPSSETIHLHFYGTGGAVDSLEVATICVPAPAAILLAGIGTAMVGWLRRRRTV